METAAVASAVTSIPVDQLKPNPWNRTVFEPLALEELAASIRSGGIEDPLIVRKTSEGQYEIASGNRRWLAAKKAGIGALPCLVRDLTDQKVAEMNIEMNVQREDLPPLELARMLKEYMGRFDQSQRDVATAFGKRESWVSEFLGYMALDPGILKNFAAAKFSRVALRGLKRLSPANQKQLAQEMQEGLDIDKVERRCNQLSWRGPKPKSGDHKVSQYLKEEGYRFTREGNDIVITARIPWGPDIDTPLAKLRASLLLWMSQQLKNGEASGRNNLRRESGGGSREEENGLDEKRPSSNKALPSPAPRLPHPASGPATAPDSEDEEEEMRRAGITRAPAYPMDKFDWGDKK